MSTNKLCGHFVCIGDEVPGQQFADARDGMVGDAGQHLAEIGFSFRSLAADLAQSGSFPDKTLLFGRWDRAHQNM